MGLQGMFIDVKDTLNNWCMAKIVSFDPYAMKVLISYDGWPQKYDEVS